MTKMLQIFKCETCGNIIQVMHEGQGELVCCGAPMQLLIPYEQKDETGEKHVPIFLNDSSVQVGSVLHPMIEKHYIEFIETLSSDGSEVYIKFLQPGQAPCMNIGSGDFTRAIEYCNIHGLWQGNKE